MKAIKNFAVYVQKLSKKDFEKYLTLFLISTALIAGITTYYIYSKDSAKVAQLKRLEQLTEKTSRIIADHERMQKEEERLQQLLEQNKDFNMKTFFEQFCGQQNITPEPGWDTRTLPVSEKFDEVELSATIKGQTTQNMVKFLDALDKKEIVYIKELVVKNEGEKKINFDITLATRKTKKGF